MCSQASTELSAHFQLFPHMGPVLEGGKQQGGGEPRATEPFPNAQNVPGSSLPFLHS